MANQENPTPSTLIQGPFNTPKSALVAAAAALNGTTAEVELSLDHSTSARGTMSRAEARVTALTPELYAQVIGLQTFGLKVTILIEDPQSNTGWSAKEDPLAQLKALMG